jgi:NitT/TauT family transport system permease protein
LTAPKAASRDPRIFLLSMAGLLALWSLLAIVKNDPSVLPTPQAVAAIIWAEAANGNLLRHVSATLARVAAGFVIAMSLGTALGLALGRSPRINAWFDPWVVVFLNLPALVVIVLCYLWIGLNEVAAIVAVAFNKTAMVLVTMREGARAFQRPLDDMAQVYRLTRWQKLRHVMAPQLAPYFASSVRNGLAVIWKIVLVVEFLGRSNGVGFQIHLHFQLFQTGYVLAYALSFVAVMLMIEYALIQPWERSANRWRAVAQ